ncbi:MAG: PTS galactitol transporter subunit IIC, partial [Acidipropionibacterium jensenii]
AAILVGYPANMSVAIILVPITLALGVLMSYAHLNQMLPFTDLADTPFFAVWATTWCRGNIARGTVIGTFFVACMLTIGTFMAPATTILAHQANFTIPQGASQISSIDSGAHLIAYFFAFFFVFGQAKAYGTAFIVFSIILLTIAVVCYVVFFAHVLRGGKPGMEDRERYMTKEELQAEAEAAEAGW